MIFMCGLFLVYYYGMKHIKDISKSKPDNTLHIYQRVSTEIQQTKGGSLDTQLKSGIKESKRLE